MYCLSQFCFLCLNREKNLISIKSLDTDKKSIQEKMIYTINDIVFLDPSYETKICKFCCDIVRVSYQFKRKCLQNNNVIIGYVKKLTLHSDIYGNADVMLDKLSEISVDIINLSYTNEETFKLLEESKISPNKKQITTPTKNIITLNSNNESPKNYLEDEYKVKPGPNFYHIKQFHSKKRKLDTSPKKIEQITKCFEENKINKYDNELTSKLDIVVKIEEPIPTTSKIVDTKITKSTKFPTLTNILESKPLIQKDIGGKILQKEDYIIKNKFENVFLNENNNLKTQTKPKIIDFVDTDTDTTNSPYFVENLNESSRSSFDFTEENIFSEEERKNYEAIRDNIFKNIEPKQEVIEIRDSPKKTVPSQTEDYITSVLLNLSKVPQKVPENVVKDIDPLQIISKPDTGVKTNKRLQLKRQRQKQARKNKSILKPIPKISKTYSNKNKSKLARVTQKIIDREDEFDSLLSKNDCDDPQIVVNLIPDTQFPKSAIVETKTPSETNFPSVKNYITPFVDPYSDPVYVLKLDHCYTMQPIYKSTVLPMRKNKRGLGRKRKFKEAIPAPKVRKIPIESTVQRHLKQSYKFRCFICYMKVPSQNDLDEHLINEHQGHQFNGCNFCPKKFTTFFSLKRHCRNVHQMTITMGDNCFDSDIGTSKNITDTTNNVNDTTNNVTDTTNNVTDTTNSV